MQSSSRIWHAKISAGTLLKYTFTELGLAEDATHSAPRRSAAGATIFPGKGDQMESHSWRFSVLCEVFLQLVSTCHPGRSLWKQPFTSAFRFLLKQSIQQGSQAQPALLSHWTKSLTKEFVWSVEIKKHLLGSLQVFNCSSVPTEEG